MIELLLRFGMQEVGTAQPFVNPNNVFFLGASNKNKRGETGWPPREVFGKGTTRRIPKRLSLGFGGRVRAGKKVSTKDNEQQSRKRAEVATH
jgi:hypothetical protein